MPEGAPVLNFGSFCIDHVYGVDRFVETGETRLATSYRTFAGGKGFNQSLALARAGARVCHAGRVGADGRWLVEELDRAGVDTRLVEASELPSGHASIQVAPGGENRILIHGGANRDIPDSQIDRALEEFPSGGTLLLQNEINGLPRIFDGAAARGAHVVMNPSPIDEALLALPLERVGTFVLNESEGRLLSGVPEPEPMLPALRERFPGAEIVLTLGERGVHHADRNGETFVPALRVRAVDTTAAGDTFTGYFLAARAAGEPVDAALRLACRAAAHCVQLPGAAASIPHRRELSKG